MDSTEMLPRVGFWRRALAAFIDSLCVSVPCSLLAGLLFFVSAGHIQASTGLGVTVCEDQTSYPDHLDPAPPTGSNFTKRCRLLSIAGETARALTVGRNETTERTVKEIARNYMLDVEDHVISGTDWSWVIWVLLQGYLIAAQSRWGRTLGLRLVRARTVLQADPASRAVPIPRLLARYAFMIGGYVPALMVLGYVFYVATVTSGEPTPSFGLLVLSFLLFTLWSLWNAVLVARKRDPLYDRWAGTAVIRT